MEFLDQVWMAAPGKCTRLLVVQRHRAEVHAANSAPLPATFLRARPDFVSENDELLSAIDQLRAQTGAAASGHGTVAETGESSWSRC